MKQRPRVSRLGCLCVSVALFGCEMRAPAAPPPPPPPPPPAATLQPVTLAIVLPETGGCKPRPKQTSSRIVVDDRGGGNLVAARVPPVVPEGYWTLPLPPGSGALTTTPAKTAVQQFADARQLISAVGLIYKATLKNNTYRHYCAEHTTVITAMLPSNVVATVAPADPASCPTPAGVTPKYDICLSVPFWYDNKATITPKQVLVTMFHADELVSDAEEQYLASP